MVLPRIIPVLLLKQNGLYKGIKFKNHIYIGDPINSVRIFNDKQVDELIILNIENSLLNSPVNIDFIQNIVSEAFMPIAYGGGIKDVDTATRLFRCGFKKACVFKTIFSTPQRKRRVAVSTSLMPPP
jgi:cyclase